MGLSCDLSLSRAYLKCLSSACPALTVAAQLTRPVPAGATAKGQCGRGACEVRRHDHRRRLARQRPKPSATDRLTNGMNGTLGYLRTALPALRVRPLRVRLQPQACGFASRHVLLRAALQGGRMAPSASSRRTRAISPARWSSPSRPYRMRSVSAAKAFPWACPPYVRRACACVLYHGER